MWNVNKEMEWQLTLWKLTRWNETWNFKLRCGAILLPGGTPSLDIATCNWFLKAKLDDFEDQHCPLPYPWLKMENSFCLLIPFSLCEISSGKEKNQNDNLLEYQQLTADVLVNNKRLWFSQIATGSKSLSYKDSHAPGEHHANFFLVAVYLSMY